MNNGTTAILSANIAITIGALVTIYPVTAYGYIAPAGAATSGAIPHSDGPTLGAVVSAYTSNGDHLADVRLMIPGKPNNNRIVTVDAAGVSN